MRFQNEFLLKKVGYFSKMSVSQIVVEVKRMVPVPWSPKPDGSKRPLGIPTVLDRLIQQSIAQVLSKIFDPGFSEYSYGFRPGRSGHQAVRAMQRDIREGYNVAVDMDLSKFFDKVDHDILMV
ncbi:reverse transcriptase domain-containing protein, partial [Desulfoluna sp.]|uniref:reverse transcriptase domain-containing protein n=1 Tax=Desulfoluna sp. TaxID=2045199 RepID=UPI00262A51CB